MRRKRKKSIFAKESFADPNEDPEVIHASEQLQKSHEVVQPTLKFNHSCCVCAPTRSLPHRNSTPYTKTSPVKPSSCTKSGWFRFLSSCAGWFAFANPNMALVICLQPRREHHLRKQMQAIMVMQKKIAERTLRVNDNYCVNSQLIMHLSRDPSYMRIFVDRHALFPATYILCRPAVK